MMMRDGHMYTHVHAHTPMHTCPCTHAHAQIPMHTHAHVPMHRYPYTYTHAHMPMHTHVAHTEGVEEGWVERMQVGS